MIAKLFTLAAFVTVVLAGAHHSGSHIENSCNVEHQFCCSSVQHSSSDSVSELLGLINVAVGSVSGQVGLICNPVQVLGAGGNSCNTQPACCTGNNFNGLVVDGCSPLAINA